MYRGLMYRIIGHYPMPADRGPGLGGQAKTLAARTGDGQPARPGIADAD